MTSITKHLNPSYFSNYVKQDPFYKTMQREYSWVHALDPWTGSKNLCKKICGYILLIFAAIHDCYNHDKIQTNILKGFSNRQIEELNKDYERDSVENQNKFTTPGTTIGQVIEAQRSDDLHKMAVSLAQLHQGSYADHLKEAEKNVKKTYGIDVFFQDTYDRRNTKVRSLTEIQFTHHFNIIDLSNPSNVLGTLIIDGNYQLRSEEGTVNYLFNWDQEKLAQKQKATDQFDYRIYPPDFRRSRFSSKPDSPSFKSYLKSPDDMEGALERLTKERIKAQYKIDCELECDTGHDYSLPSTQTKNYQCEYFIIDPKTKVRIGKIKADGAFYFAQESADITFDVTFDNLHQVRQMYLQQCSDRAQQLVDDFL